MKMVSMKLPPPKKGDANDQMGSCGQDGDDMYPYGLRISLQDEQLTSLGIKDMPKVGSTMTVTATVSVAGVRSNQTKDKGGKAGEERSVDLQITDMALDGQKTNAADALYGGTPKAKPGAAGSK